MISYFDYIDLVEEINRHMNAYYNLDEPVISDYEYDMLMQKLKKAEYENPDWVTPDSPSQKIGGVAKRTAGLKVTHDVPMLSIEDVFEKKAVEEWVDKVHAIHPECEFSVETKIDGLSMTLRYSKNEGELDDGKLHLRLAETRGDGIVGEDVTANAKVINDVKQIIDLPYDSLELRGEVYMTHENFKKYNSIQESLGKKLAANPRNLAAGTLRQLRPSITKERGLAMFVFNVQSGPDELTNSHVAGMKILNDVGVPVTYNRKCRTKEEIIKAIDDIAEMRSELPYDIDGAVVKIDSVKDRNDFPAGSKYSPGHIAYKYPPEEKIVVIDKILVDVGRTGKLTFTGEFHDRDTGRPARLCGTNVSRASLHNMDYISSMKIGLGGHYRLFKSGEIIPKLNGCVVEPNQVFICPTECPVCGSKLEKEDDTADIRCISSSCKVQLSRTVTYFASLAAMNIVGLGETIIDSLVNEGYIKNCADIYSLKNHRDELISKGIIGKEKNTDKILAAIEASKNNDAVKLLTGLGIRNVGKNTAKELMKNFNSIVQLANADFDTLIKINDIGETTAKCIIDYFNLESTRILISQLINYEVNLESRNDENVKETLEGLTFVITGTLPNYDRKEIELMIENNGGKCTSSVSRKTSYVIAGDATGSKLTKAIELGIKVINEEEFIEMIK